MFIIHEINIKLRMLLNHASIISMEAIMLICMGTTVCAQNYSYVGADFSYMHATFAEGYGKNVFSTKPMPQINIFYGYYCGALLGFEIGYAQTQTIKGAIFIPAMTSDLGVPYFTAVASNVYDTSQVIKGMNINYVPRVELFKGFSVVAVLGAAYLHTIDKLILTQFDGADATSLQQANYSVNFAANKLVPRAGMRMQYIFSHFGVRIAYLWEQTSLLQMHSTRPIKPKQVLTAKLRNAGSIGVGVFYKFGT